MKKNLAPEGSIFIYCLGELVWFTKEKQLKQGKKVNLIVNSAKHLIWFHDVSWIILQSGKYIKFHSYSSHLHSQSQLEQALSKKTSTIANSPCIFPSFGFRKKNEMIYLFLSFFFQGTVYLHFSLLSRWKGKLHKVQVKYVVFIENPGGVKVNMWFYLLCLDSCRV